MLYHIYIYIYEFRCIGYEEGYMRICVYRLRIVKNVGVSTGFVGCVESLKIESNGVVKTYDLTHDSSVDIESELSISKCKSRIGRKI